MHERKPRLQFFKGALFSILYTFSKCCVRASFLLTEVAGLRSATQ